MTRPTFSRKLSSFALVFLITALFALGFSRRARAQISTATASINGTVKDSSGAVIPGAEVTLINALTGVRQTSRTNGSGGYTILDVPPGQYTLEVSRKGFISARQTQFTLYVNQTATFDFTLSVGSATQSVTVTALGGRIESSTAELGSVIGSQQVNDMPLNGRNFTELLTLSPGVSPISSDQNSSGWPAQPIGSFTFPSVNGQPNRSNLFLLDGVNNNASFTSTYAVQPVLDDIQEFKTQSHNDEAQFGGVLGGIVNVVTKAGTNQFHGDVWEFLRNDKLDARNFFVPDRTPLKQNQFGAAVGGPVILPGYNGRNRTFFFASYEGFRNHTASESLYLVPTQAELMGDLSGIESQIYNPFSTRPDPANPGQFLRDPFPGNQVPQNVLDPGMVLFAKTLYPGPIDTGVAGFNGRDTTPNVVRQDEGTIRFDEQLRPGDRFFVRYTGLSQPSSGSGGFTGLSSDVFFHSYSAAANWTHTFGGSALLQVTFGRNSMQYNQFGRFKNVDPAQFVQQVGFSPNYVGDFFLPGLTLIPNMSIEGYLGGGELINLLHASNVYQYKADFSKIYGRHTLRMGADLATNGFDNPVACLCSESFCAFNTSNLETSDGGDALASFLLGIPASAFRGNEKIVDSGGRVDGFYFQDQWHATSKLTLNLGLRYDVTLLPTSGAAADRSDAVGNFDLNNGTYVLQAAAPACSATVGAPCIPGGTLPEHVLVSPTRHLLRNTYDNVQPRVGVAYRLTPNTALRASFGRFFDNWAGVTQEGAIYALSWPSVGALGAGPLNTTIPDVTAENPLSQGNGPIVPSSTPMDQVIPGVDPLAKTAYSDQWNVGFQRQLGLNTVLAANYVGAHDSRLPLFLSQNVALTPGPGDPQARAQFPYIAVQPYTRSWGKSNYNALQVSLNRQTSRGLTYLISYTWSKAMNFGCDGYYSDCSVQDPNHWQNNRSVAGFDLTHVFSASWVYHLPFGSGRRWASSNRLASALFGGWQLNGIVFLSSGQPYTIGSSGDIANIGGGSERANLVGNPIISNPTPEEWFNTAAFVNPDPFTFGNLGRNTLRADWNKNFDLSIFREFPITETKKLEFRFEGFNITNTPVFGIPDNTVADPNFGAVSNTANTERQLQFALKFYF
ncbi:MAG TPA: TonB-dependent receptor [Terriglobia bacterium]|nr:TonB-dependent receptor [Terriglobia bacterium]